MNEAVNESSKLVAKSLDCIKNHLQDDNIDLDLGEIVMWLEEVIVKLTNTK